MLVASFHSFTWTGFSFNIGLGLAPAVIAASLGSRGALPGTRGNIMAMAGLAGIVVTITSFCGLPKTVDWHGVEVLLPLLLGVAVAYGLARFLAR